MSVAVCLLNNTIDFMLTILEYMFKEHVYMFNLLNIKITN
jgi:hypothetical protein